ncbi:MAG: SRPBCC family protein [Bdellovibrionota bacterium]
MSNSLYPDFNPKLDLKIQRVVDVPPELVWKAWTTPEHVKHWFAPSPWTTTDCKIDLRPGGVFHTTMRSPEGQEYPSGGCFVEVIENKKLVFTDALQPGFRPSERPFFTAMIILEPEGRGTKYTAIALHRDEAGKKGHEEMGFEVGWSKCLDQLVAHIKNSF